MDLKSLRLSFSTLLQLGDQSTLDSATSDVQKYQMFLPWRLRWPSKVDCNHIKRDKIMLATCCGQLEKVKHRTILRLKTGL